MSLVHEKDCGSVRIDYIVRLLPFCSYKIKKVLLEALGRKINSPKSAGWGSYDFACHALELQIKSYSICTNVN
jgi:hypothetical protein